MTQYLKTDFGELKFYQNMLVNIWMGGWDHSRDHT